MSVYIILNAPSAFDFHALSEATIKSLEVLAPITELRDRSMLIYFRIQRIAVQIHEYIGAIQSGFVAAQYGFTAADDIISLAQMLDTSTPEEREEYLIGTLELANKAYSAVQESYQVLRNVRATMTFLMEQQIDQLRSIHSGNQVAGRRMLNAINNIRSQIYILENFAAHAGALARWWDWLKIETDPHPLAHSHAPSASFDCDSLRNRSVIQRWILLRNQFADFTDMGRRLEGLYPRILADNSVRRKRRQSRNAARSDIQQALKSVGRASRRRQTVTPDVFDHAEPWTEEKSQREEQVCCCIVM
ncbi:hypothetical protein CVT24_013166 [Panaeolus cyanescens]|uniref:Uncharacterized protein n=1 Tax=Panaeolus cyanescens TaxID=181874 RepID=A0A409WQS4_9AGAR|nr:hypothetical protein CVT24_013166 [Panaeolus cyanescens]